MKKLLLVSGWLVAALLLALPQVVAQDNSQATLRLWDGSGNLIGDYSCYSTEYEPSPTPEPAYTIEPTITPTATPSCNGQVTADRLNVRSGPGVNNSVVDAVYRNDIILLEGRALDSLGTWWYKIYGGWVSSVYIQTSCTPPLMTVFGLHLTVGVSQDVVYANLPRIGSIKGTDGTENIIIGAHIQRPDIIYVWRNLNGGLDCPTGWADINPIILAESWWNKNYSQWQARGLLDAVDYFELINECRYPGSMWEYSFWSTILNKANTAGICVALFSDGYGNPQIHEFQNRASILDLVLETECQSGKRHIIALHSYEGANSGNWKFGRWKLFMSALGTKYTQIPILFTEYAYNLGRPPTDCTLLWNDWKLAEKEYYADKQVIGINYFNLGVGEWGDISKCLN